MLNDTSQQGFLLRRLILVDSYRAGSTTEVRLDGHTAVNGANGSGKTTLLRLIPLFYGESTSKLVKPDGVRQSFVQHYLPRPTSYILFEYERRGQANLVALYSSGNGESVSLSPAQTLSRGG